MGVHLVGGHHDEFDRLSPEKLACLDESNVRRVWVVVAPGEVIDTFGAGVPDDERAEESGTSANRYGVPSVMRASAIMSISVSVRSRTSMARRSIIAGRSGKREEGVKHGLTRSRQP